MKKLFLLLCLVLGFAALSPVAARADYFAGPRRVYVIESGVPVARVVYFDRAGRCYRPHGPRRVYYETYYTSYPHWYGRPRRVRVYEDDYYYRPHVRPRVSFSFGL